MDQPIPVEKIEMDKEEVGYWKKEIEASRTFRQKEFIDRVGYQKLIEYWEGLQKADFQADINQIAIINEIYPGFSSIINNTYVQNPTITVKGKTPQAEGNLTPQALFQMQMGMPPQIPLTDLMRSAVQYAIEKYDLKGEAKLALFDFLFAGFACIEANHTVLKNYNEREPLNSGLMDKLKEAVQGITNTLTGKTDEKTEDKIAAEQAEAKKDDAVDETYIMWWSPLDILLDYRAKVFNRSRFIGKEKEFTLAEFKKDYPDFADRIPTSDAKLLKYSSHSSKDNSQTIKVVELQIKKTDGLYILHTCDSIDEALCYYKSRVITNGFTVKYASLDKYGILYPMSRAKMAKKPQDELNHYVTLQMEHADRSQKKIAVYYEGLSEKGKNSVESGDVYAIVEKKVPGDVFESMPVGGVSPENTALQALNLESLNKVIGSNELAKSGRSESEFTTQDTLKNQALQVNVNMVEDALGDLLRQVLDTVKDIILQFWDKDIYLKVTGLPGQDQWYTPEMGKLADVLTGDYLVDIDITSARRRNPDSDRNELNQLVMGLMSPPVMQLLMASGKKPSVGLIEEWVKSFGKNPKVVLEDMQMPQIAPVAPAPTLHRGYQLGRSCLLPRGPPLKKPQTK